MLRQELEEVTKRFGTSIASLRADLEKERKERVKLQEALVAKS